jgi:hypothetical protein
MMGSPEGSPIGAPFGRIVLVWLQMGQTRGPDFFASK